MAYDYNLLDEAHLYDNGSGLSVSLINWIQFERPEETFRPGDVLLQRLYLTDTTGNYDPTGNQWFFNQITVLPYCPAILTLSPVYGSPNIGVNQDSLPINGSPTWKSFFKTDYIFPTTMEEFLVNRNNRDMVLLGVETRLLNTNDLMCPAIPTTLEEFHTLYDPGGWTRPFSHKYFKCLLEPKAPVYTLDVGYSTYYDYGMLNDVGITFYGHSSEDVGTNFELILTAPAHWGTWEYDVMAHSTVTRDPATGQWTAVITDESSADLYLGNGVLELEGILTGKYTANGQNIVAIGGFMGRLPTFVRPS